MLCGIGGATIEEAKRKLSVEEFYRWAAYRNKRGSLHVGMRVERSTAVLAMILANRYKKEGSTPYTIYDFAPHMEEPELAINDLKGWK